MRPIESFVHFFSLLLRCANEYHTSFALSLSPALHQRYDIQHFFGISSFLMKIRYWASQTERAGGRKGWRMATDKTGKAHANLVRLLGNQVKS